LASARLQRLASDALTKYPWIEPAADIALFGYLTGWRLGEILDLTLTAVNLQAGEVWLYDSKNGEGRVRPIVEPDLRALLERRTAEHVFHDLRTHGVQRLRL
jgi:integrase